MVTRFFLFFLFLLSTALASEPKVSLGVENLLNTNKISLLLGKRVGLVTNHTGVDGKLRPTVSCLKEKAKEGGYQVTAFFAPEHGLTGAHHNSEKVEHAKDKDGIPIFSLHGSATRPTPDMLKEVDIILYDIQDIGCRSYTYATTLFYVMEEAAKHHIPVVVLDRPNPMGGLLIDGPMLEEKWRSMVGYINVPYCHGMTIGELALFFNGEYKIGCELHVIPMKGWHREMLYKDTGLTWIPTSPQLPENDTPFFYPTTGILGELQILNIGIGYTLPFKIVGAPWIDAEKFADSLNKQKFPGVHFQPFYYKPFFGRFAQKDCQGVLIVLEDPKVYKPVSTQFLILGMLKSLYPEQFQVALKEVKHRKEMFHKVNGTEKVYNTLVDEPFAVWPLRRLHEEERKQFYHTRKKYLLKEYA